MRASGYLALLAIMAAGLQLAGAAPAPEPRRAHALRRTSAIAIDGRLDEPTWTAAPRQSAFIQRFPKDGATADLETSFAVVYDDEALYVGVWADDPHPEQVRALLARRDLDIPADWVAISIDSYHDRRTAYAFQLDAAGVQRDYIIFDDSTIDDTWDAVWVGDAALTEHGWTAELRIPFSQLRFSDGDHQEWGLQVQRFVARTEELSTWSPWPRSAPQIVSKYGIVDSIDHVGSRRLELLPYATVGFNNAPVATGDPLNSEFVFRRSAGLDLKYGIGPAFTLSATLNPDFSQVEADPSQVNLTGRELYFAEKRPFFLEGIDLFKLPVGPLYRDPDPERLFYTRRIGAQPPNEPSDYSYIRWPTSTTIYGAAKLTGRSSSGWSVGALDAVTGEESAAIVDATGKTSTPVVAPLTNYSVLRVKHDLNDGNTSIGGAATSVLRALSGTPLAASLHDQAYTGGLQLDHRWADNAWGLRLNVMGSWIHGSEEAIAATQQDTIHTFQRPDASDAHFDPHRTSMAGMAANWEGGRVGDTEHWRYGFGGFLRTPGLEINDLGFQSSADRFQPYLFAFYHDEEPSRILLNWQNYAFIYFESNFDPLLKVYGAGGTISGQLTNYWSVQLDWGYDINRWDPSALRGGPALRTDPKPSGTLQISSDTRKAVRFSAAVSAAHASAGPFNELGIDVGATVQALAGLDLSLGPSWYRRGDPLQYVALATDMAGAPHYVFGTIDEQVASLTARVNWTLSPHLSIQGYAQPYIATGAYRALKDVDDPHADRFSDRFHVFTPGEYSIDRGTVSVNHNGAQYSFAQPDFDLLQLRSTFALRWEYRPGSTLFVIWSHDRSSSSLDGSFRLGTDIGTLARTDGENLVMVKLNYWTGL